jgi:hypothetical protein
MYTEGGGGVELKGAHKLWAQVPHGATRKMFISMHVEQHVSYS